MPKTKDKKTHTEIFVVLDRSGSMHAIREDAVGGFNQFVEEQAQQPGTANLSLLQFDHEWQIVYEGKPIAEVEPLNDETYQPRGSTALLDAINRGIGTLGDRLAKGREGESIVVFVILTDGLENASREVDRATVMEEIKRRESSGWGFVYLGANQDAIGEAQALGINPQGAATFDSALVGATALGTSNMVARYRSSGGMAQSLSYTAAERDSFVGTAPDELVSTGEAARQLGVSPKTLQRMRGRSEGPKYVRPTKGSVRYRRQDLADWLSENTQ